MSAALLLATPLCAALALLSPPRQGAPTDDGVVFVPDLCGEKEGAPPAKNLGKLVLLTDLSKQDPWYVLVTRLVQAKKPAAVIDFPAGKPDGIAAVRAGLARELPEFAIVVTKPDHLDVNSHFALLETVASLDADPFVDVAFGYVTGATLEEAKAFVERILALAAKKEPLPQKLIEFGPVAQGPPQFGGPQSDPLARGWKRWFAYHGPVAEMIAKKELLSGLGIVRAGGHGMPCGIDHGLQGADLRREKIDFGGALYFSGPCYCGVVSGWYAAGNGGVERRVVKPEESFALAAIAQGVGALFAGFDPDRGETCSQEMEHLFEHGDALGHASKETYDGVVIARRQKQLALFRYEEGKPMPQAGIVDTMTGGGACRALFGDPTWKPFAACADPAFDVKKKETAKSLELSWSAPQADTKHWSVVDVYRCEGGWTHRIAFKIEIPLAVARSLKKLEVKELTAQDKAVEHHFPTAMIERFGGKAYLHVYVVFPPRGQQNLFFVERDWKATFAFARG